MLEKTKGEKLMQHRLHKGVNRCKFGSKMSANAQDKTVTYDTSDNEAKKLTRMRELTEKALQREKALPSFIPGVGSSSAASTCSCGSTAQGKRYIPSVSRYQATGCIYTRL